MDKKTLGGLLDFSFSEFVTTKIIKVLYILWLALAVIVGISILFNGFASRSFFGFMGGLVFAPIATLLIAIYGRVALELVIVVFRIAENTSKLAGTDTSSRSE